jgi:hypothetical protein
VVVTALAMEVAGTDDPIAAAEEIPGVTAEGEACDTFEACRDIIADGGDPDYEGQSGPISLDDVGDPTQASFGILTFNAENQIDEATIEYRLAETGD